MDFKSYVTSAISMHIQETATLRNWNKYM
jgi:hypothetical protein